MMVDIRSLPWLAYIEALTADRGAMVHDHKPMGIVRDRIRS